MEVIQNLEWDTTFFGFPIARIVNPRARSEELHAAIVQLRERQIPLAYWAADKPSLEIQNVVRDLGGSLVDEKLTFVKAIGSLAKFEATAGIIVEPYRDGMPMDDLKRLAVDSGLHSRFVVDRKFPQDKARAMFEEWIVRSVNKAMADEVLVICRDSRIAGLATVMKKGDRGSIGLVAVAATFRGQGFGEALVRTAEDWCRQRGLQQIQVTTQSANVPATRLYQKCGFQLEMTEHFYHIWS